MDNEIVHRALHKKLSNTLDDLSGLGKIEGIPSYYGEILFTEEIQETTDEHIKAACNKIMGKETTQDLPDFLNELLKTDKETLIAQLLEYYTRSKLLTKNNS